MTEVLLRELLGTAVDAALAAAACLKNYFGSQALGVEQKDDGSPVTRADQEAEAIIRAHLRSHSPAGELDILGEEQGLEGPGTRWRWTVDPIDGTRSFVHGIPLFGTMIGLEDTHEERPLIGVIHLPMLGRTYAAARGQGATCDGQHVRLPESVSIADSIIGVGDVSQFVAADRLEDYRHLLKLNDFVRSYSDCFGHGLTVSGALGAMLDPALSRWDILPTQVLIEEAGGAIVLQPSRVPTKVDALFGNRALVRLLAARLSFQV